MAENNGPKNWEELLVGQKGSKCKEAGKRWQEG